MRPAGRAMAMPVISDGGYLKMVVGTP